MADSFPILTVLVLTPLVGAILVMLAGHFRPEVVKLIAWLAAIVTGAFCLWLLAAFDSVEAGFQFVSQHFLFEHWGNSWYLHVAHISFLLLGFSGSPAT